MRYFVSCWEDGSEKMIYLNIDYVRHIERYSDAGEGPDEIITGDHKRYVCINPIPEDSDGLDSFFDSIVAFDADNDSNVDIEEEF